MQQITVNCKACGFVGAAIIPDEELAADEAAPEDEEEGEECPRCGATLTAPGEARTEAPKNTGVTTFSGTEEPTDEEDDD